MGPIAMAVCIAFGFGFFAFSINKKWRLLKIGSSENRFDHLKTRFKNLFVFALFQKKLPKYPIMGPVHMCIFWGFLVLLINTMILWGRGFDADFSLWILGEDTFLGHVYNIIKDFVTMIVLLAATVALINRAVLRPKRITKSIEAAAILLIIIVMMVADLIYAGWQLTENNSINFLATEPFASSVAILLMHLDKELIVLLGTIGFWTHSILVLIFLNLLPFGKHFHVITSLPNVFFSKINPPGKLPRDHNIEKVLNDEEDEEEPVFGVAQVQDFTWKDILDMYSCTECGRCTDNCPAAKTNKPLSPKTFITKIRDHLYSRQDEFLSGKIEPTDLVPDVIDPEEIWSCTTCRACEEECPVMNTFVDKIIKLRRDLVESRGEIPSELATALRAMETNSNPWNLSPMDKDNWTKDIEIKKYDPDNTEYLLFVGCDASFDDRAQKITQSLVRLLNKANVNYGYLGTDEPCCGETARRAGSESNFRMMADMNIETFKDLKVKKIITVCPHCLNTLKNEYGDFDGNYTVIHHTQILADLIKSGKLKPTEKIDQKITYHDACYLGRYNDIYNPPRQILSSIPGLQFVEVSTNKERGLCCGAGGSRYFMEEDNDKRVNNLRTNELLETNAQSIATACPYCMSMLSDGLKEKDLFDKKGQLDVAELLAISCGLGSRKLLKEDT